MKICIPVLEDLGEDSRVSEHFGSAPFFLVYDSDNDSSECLANTNQHHSHGTCNPLAVLSSYQLDAVVCGGMGKRAVLGLNSSGIKVFMSQGVTIKEILAFYVSGQLVELTPEKACSQHQCHS